MSRKQIPFPINGLGKDALLAQMKELSGDDINWKQGRTFSLVYNPGPEISSMVKEAYNLFFSENALNPTAFPSLRRMEAEVVSMTANLFHGENAAGTMSSGGTESIFLALHTARQWALKNRPRISEPEIILPASAHPAFHKACHYLQLKTVVIPLDENSQANMTEMWSAINKNTIMLVGSAPSYPHGIIDPIEKMSTLAIEKKLLLHVDACIGGFLLPFIKKLGYTIPAFDFSLPGVTSISADIHKYGYAAKGASIILYKDALLRRHQFYVYTNWNGGIYGSSTAGGTRPGGAIAAAWGAINGIGLDGYLKLAQTTMDVAHKFKTAIKNTPELRIIANPSSSIFAFTSDKLDIYAIGDEMSVKGWLIDRQQEPPSIHLTISPIHETVADEFISDLHEAVEKVKKMSFGKVATKVQVAAVKGLKKLLPDKAFNKLKSLAAGGNSVVTSKRTAAMYGMMGALADSDDLDELIIEFMDQLNSL